MLWAALTTGRHGCWRRTLTSHFIRQKVGLCSKLPKPYRDVLPLARLHLHNGSITSQNSATNWAPGLQIHEREGGVGTLFLISTTISVYTGYYSIGKEGRDASLSV